VASGHFSPAPIDCSAFSTVSICKKHVCYAQYWGWTRLECLIVPGSSTANLVLKLSDPRKPVFGIRGPLIVPGLWSSAIGTRRQWISFNKSDRGCGHQPLEHVANGYRSTRATCPVATENAGASPSFQTKTRLPDLGTPPSNSPEYISLITFILCL